MHPKQKKSDEKICKKKLHPKTKEKNQLKKFVNFFCKNKKTHLPRRRAAAPSLPAARRSPTPPLLAELGPRGARRRCRSRSSVPWSPLPPPPLEELSPRVWPPPLAEVSHGEPAARTSPPCRSPDGRSPSPCRSPWGRAPRSRIRRRNEKREKGKGMERESWSGRELKITWVVAPST